MVDDDDEVKEREREESDGTSPHSLVQLKHFYRARTAGWSKEHCSSACLRKDQGFQTAPVPTSPSIL